MTKRQQSLRAIRRLRGILKRGRRQKPLAQEMAAHKRVQLRLEHTNR